MAEGSGGGQLEAYVGVTHADDVAVGKHVDVAGLDGVAVESRAALAGQDTERVDAYARRRTAHLDAHLLAVHGAVGGWQLDGALGGLRLAAHDVLALAQCHGMRPADHDESADGAADVIGVLRGVFVGRRRRGCRHTFQRGERIGLLADRALQRPRLDAGHGYKGGFAAHDGRLSYADVREAFAACRAKNKMIFADACFSGGMREAGHDTSLSQFNIMLFLSSRGNETSLDGNPRRGQKNGLFTICLERCLRGGADADRDRIITARELFVAVTEGVKTLSHDRQHPVMWGKFDDTMPVMRW